MKRIAAGSKGGKNFGVAGVHGEENARVVVQCEDGSMFFPFFLLSPGCFNGAAYRYADVTAKSPLT